MPDPSTIQWQKSPRCGSSSCLEFSRTSDGDFLLRDSKNPGQEPLRFYREEMDAWVGAIRDGEILEDVG